MSSEDTVFTIYHSGKFKTTEQNALSYVGGEIHTLECKSDSMLENLKESLNVTLSEHRIWYKLPFETFLDLKIICNGNGSFERMVIAANYTHEVDIYLEKNEVGNERAIENEMVNERVYGESSRRDHVEENLEGWNDEDEKCDSEGTPPNSDSEEVSRKNVRCKKGSGDIRIGQAFDTIAEFKDAVVDYALNKGKNVRFSRWGYVTSEVRCSLPGCNFKIYCSEDKEQGMFIVKTCRLEHSCIPDGYSKVVKDGIIAKLLLNDIKKNINFKPMEMQDKIEERFNLTVSNDQCRKAKAKALSIIQDEQDEQFARLKDYRLELLDANPGSTVEVGTSMTDDGKEKFDRFYVCLEPLRKAWLAECRPIIGIDGCHLKNNVKGILLAAIGRDANNQFYPVAWSIVPVENIDSWIWFIRLLKTDLKLEDGNGFTIISDRQKGLLNAVERELPKVEHRMCARHIYGNLRRVFPGKELPKKLFWAVAKSFNIAEYERAIEALKDYDKGVFEAVMMKNPRNCSRAFFTCTSMCEDVSNNFSESYNNTINKARAMPLVDMLETIRRQCMCRNDTRKKKALKHQGKFSEKVANTIAEEEKHKKYCQVIPCGNGHYEVTEHNHGFRVDMNAKTCACRRWNMTGIPCRHVLRVISKKKLQPEDFVTSDWYLTSRWVNQYSETLMGLNGMYLWPKSGETRIEPPPRITTKGPVKNQKRIKGKNESPQKKKKKKGNEEELSQEPTKLTRKGSTVMCRRCGLSGHNSRGCHFSGVSRIPKNYNEPSGEGPSQASQASQSQSSQISLGD